MLEKDFSLDGIFIVFFSRLFLFSSPPLQFDWHGTAEEEMWVKGQHHPTMGPTCLPRAASGHALTLAKDQGCETETRSRRAAEQPRPAAGRRLASGVIETEHGVQSSQSSRFFSSAISTSICLLHSALRRRRRAEPARAAELLAPPFSGF